MPEPYWRIEWNKWVRVAFSCRYGHQALPTILNRDLDKNPLTALEMALFERAILEHLESEFKAKSLDVATSVDD